MKLVQTINEWKNQGSTVPAGVGELNLEYRLIKDGASDIFQALKGSHIVKSLVFSGNSLGHSTGVPDLVRYLDSDTVLQKLDLRSNTLNTEQALQIVHAIESHPSIALLNLTCNDLLRTSGFEDIVRGILRNKSLVSVDLDWPSHYMTSTLYQNMTEHLRRNRQRRQQPPQPQPQTAPRPAPVQPDPDTKMREMYHALVGRCGEAERRETMANAKIQSLENNNRQLERHAQEIAVQIKEGKGRESLLQNHVDDLKKKMAEEEKKAGGVRERNLELEKSCQHLEFKLEYSEKEKVETTKQLEESENKRDRLNDEVEQLRETVRSQEGRIYDLNRELKGEEEDSKKWKAESDRLHDKLLEATSASNLTSDKDFEEVRRKNIEIEALRDEVAALKEALANASDDRVRQENENKTRVKEYERRIDEFANAVKDKQRLLQEEIMKTKEQEHTIQQLSDQVVNSDSLREKRDRLIMQLEQDKSEKDKEIGALERRIERLQDDCQSEKAEKERYKKHFEEESKTAKELRQQIDSERKDKLDALDSLGFEKETNRELQERVRETGELQKSLGAEKVEKQKLQSTLITKEAKITELSELLSLVRSTAAKVE